MPRNLALTWRSSCRRSIVNLMLWSLPCFKNEVSMRDQAMDDPEQAALMRELEAEFEKLDLSPKKVSEGNQVMAPGDMANTAALNAIASLPDGPQKTALFAVLEASAVTPRPDAEAGVLYIKPWYQKKNTQWPSDIRNAAYGSKFNIYIYITRFPLKEAPKVKEVLAKNVPYAREAPKINFDRVFHTKAKTRSKLILEASRPGPLSPWGPLSKEILLYIYISTYAPIYHRWRRVQLMSPLRAVGSLLTRMLVTSGSLCKQLCLDWQDWTPLGWRPGIWEPRVISWRDQ